jgi:hypothetical protein
VFQFNPISSTAFRLNHNRTYQEDLVARGQIQTDTAGLERNQEDLDVLLTPETKTELRERQEQGIGKRAKEGPTGLTLNASMAARRFWMFI